MRDLAVSYGGNVAIRDVNIDVREGGDGVHRLAGLVRKSTLIRCFDRMNDLVPNARVEGEVLYHGKDLYADDVDLVEVRRRTEWSSRNRTCFRSRSSTRSRLGRGTGRRAT